MKIKSKLLIPMFIIALIIWVIVLIKQQVNIAQYQEEIDDLSAKIEVAQEELNQKGNIASLKTRNNS